MSKSGVDGRSQVKFDKDRQSRHLGATCKTFQTIPGSPSTQIWHDVLYPCPLRTLLLNLLAKPVSLPDQIITFPVVPAE